MAQLITVPTPYPELVVERRNEPYGLDVSADFILDMIDMALEINLPGSDKASFQKTSVTKGFNTTVFIHDSNKGIDRPMIDELVARQVPGDIMSWISEHEGTLITLCLDLLPTQKSWIAFRLNEGIIPNGGVVTPGILRNFMGMDEEQSQQLADAISIGLNDCLNVAGFYSTQRDSPHSFVLPGRPASLDCRIR